MFSMNLRDFIADTIDKTVQATITGGARSKEDYEQNRMACIQMATDAIVEAFGEFLPPPVDIRAKYEVEPNTGVHLSLCDPQQPRAYERDMEQLAYLSRYADDEGYNRYHEKITLALQGLYTVPTEGVESKSN